MTSRKPRPTAAERRRLAEIEETERNTAFRAAYATHALS
jgi:hypothetical protein